MRCMRLRLDLRDAGRRSDSGTGSIASCEGRSHPEVLEIDWEAPDFLRLGMRGKYMRQSRSLGIQHYYFFSGGIRKSFLRITSISNASHANI